MPTVPTAPEDGFVSVARIMELPQLVGARVVAGVAGLERPVRHVNVMEVPDILRWVGPDELLLTTAYPLRDDPVGLAALIPGLAEHGLAALALKPARYIEAIPAEMLAAADRLDFPLIELPPEASFNEIINAILTVILNAQALRLQRAAEMHDQFTAIVLGGGGLRQIAATLSTAIGRPVAILDAQGVLQATVGGASGLGPAGSLLVPGEAFGGPTIAGAPAVLQPIQAGSERFGTIVVLAATSELSADQLDAVEYAATVAALRQVQARVVAEADRRFQAICLEELVSGHVERSVLMERALAFSWDLSLARAVVLARLDELDGQPFETLAGTAAEAAARHRLLDAARTALGRTAITWERTAEVASLVVDGQSPEDVRAQVARFLAEAGRQLPGAVVSVGAGRARTDAVELAESYREARRAIEVGRWSRGPGSVSIFGELGVDQLLAGIPAAEQEDFARTTLGVLLDHDAAHRGELVPTLEAFLATRNAALTARRLFVHYNTVKARLRTIEELLGPVLSDPDRSLGLALALRIRRSPRV